VIAGRYVLEQEVGRGRSTSVWAGRDTVLARRVALKRLGYTPGSDEVDAARAEREARLAARVHHPHVVSVYDLVDDGDHTWLVMELVDGPTLADLCDGSPLDTERAVRLLAQTADALATAHAQGLVHRDVKPSNVFVTGDDVAKLGDFGIARQEMDEALTRTGLITGSPAYLSPEIARGRTATPASDVWAFGISVYRVATGAAPYDVEGDDVITAVQKILDTPPPILPAAHPLAPIVAAATRTAPEDRATMRELADRLHALARDGVAPVSTPVPVPARATAPVPTVRETTTTLPRLDDRPALPPPTAGRARTRRRDRRRVLAAAAALVVVGGLGATAVLRDAPDADTPTAVSNQQEATTPQERMERFAADYVRTAASDPTRGFEQLTPSYQQASGGLAGYTDFWGRVQDVQVGRMRSDPEQMRVTYTYSYVMDGVRRSQALTLLLTQADGGYLIRGAVAA
jgi:tRNA A-37 threonylcarbamoyl transferase component Bud32